MSAREAMGAQPSRRTAFGVQQLALDEAAWGDLQSMLSAAPDQLPAAMTRLLSEPSVLERPLRG